MGKLSLTTAPNTNRLSGEAEEYVSGMCLWDYAGGCLTCWLRGQGFQHVFDHRDPRLSSQCRTRLGIRPVIRGIAWSNLFGGSQLSSLRCGSTPMGSHFGVGAPPILEPILVGIGMFTGILRGYDLDFDPRPDVGKDACDRARRGGLPPAAVWRASPGL